MTNIYKNNNNLDVDNQINKILKGSTPITNLNNNTISDSESNDYSSEIKPIKNRKKKNYKKKEMTPAHSTETNTEISDTPKKLKNKSIQVSDNNQTDKQISSVKDAYSKIKDATILLILYIILSSDHMLVIFDRFIPNLGTDNNNKQLILGLIFRGLILVILFLASKKYLI